jgi:serine/threonine-protein kinase
MQPGTRLGHYEILSALGKGGMGEVWRARDTKLRRDVAVKTLPAELAERADRLARLEREATSLAAVNHPNIASIYGLEEHAGSRYLVLELVEGDTLEERLRKGPVPVEQALKIALQIAEALEAAHEKGVIHRDLKPANVKVTSEGRVKVLDFGLAKTVPTAERAAPTQLTVHGEAPALMGTPPYMSPEQARGESVSRQTDIWSLGVVLYEMLTGDSPFDRGAATETLARVLEAHPDFAKLPKATPASARHLLRRCLEKDVRRRIRDSGDARIEIEDALAALGTGPVDALSDTAVTRAGSSYYVAVALAGVAVAVLAGLAAWMLADRASPSAASSVARLSIAGLEPRGIGTRVGAQSLAISADGSRVAYSGASKLLIRPIDEQEGIRIDAAASNPFFSPDGGSVGYFFDGWKRVPSGGGSATLVAYTTERALGATWGSDGTIVFATTAGLHAVSAAGSEPEFLVGPDRERGERLYSWPHFLPDGGAILFTIMPEDASETARIAWLDLQSLEIHTLLTGGTCARYVPTGHLVYAAGQTLAAVAFDAEARTLQGDPVTIPNVAVETSVVNGSAEFAVSAAGTLVYIAPTRASPPNTLVWVDREGNQEPLTLEPGPYIYPRVSPDGTRVAINVGGANRDIWIWDLERASPARLTDGPTEDMTPIWSHDSRRVYFSSDRTGNFDVYSQVIDGSGDARDELVSPMMHAPNAVSPDGRYLVAAEDYRDVTLLDLASGAVTPLFRREGVNDWTSDISPDGNWIANESDESGTQFEIYLRPFPDVMARREKVSIDGGRYPRWGPAGSGELYYVDLEGNMMAVPVEFAPSLRIGRPTKLFETARPPTTISARPYDVAPDGRFIVTKPAGEFSAEPVNVSVVLNWFEELEALVPTR